MIPCVLSCRQHEFRSLHGLCPAKLLSSPHANFHLRECCRHPDFRQFPSTTRDLAQHRRVPHLAGGDRDANGHRRRRHGTGALLHQEKCYVPVRRRGIPRFRLTRRLPCRCQLGLLPRARALRSSFSSSLERRRFANFLVSLDVCELARLEGRTASLESQPADRNRYLSARRHLDIRELVLLCLDTPASRLLSGLFPSSSSRSRHPRS